MAHKATHRTMGALAAVMLLSQCAKTSPPLPTAPLVLPPLCPPQPDAANVEAVDRMRAALLRVLALQRGMQVGDIGTGGGWFTVRVAKAIGKDGRVYGTDINAATLDGLRHAPPLGEDAAPMQFTLVTGERETGLDDVPDNSLDLLMMIDSLCFDDRVPRAANRAYLGKFLRVLKPGGRLVHHMDCTCRTTVAETEALFVASGFTEPPGHPQLTCAELSTAACPTAEAQARAQFVGVFQKAR